MMRNGATGWSEACEAESACANAAAKTNNERNLIMLACVSWASSLYNRQRLPRPLDLRHARIDLPNNAPRHLNCVAVDGPGCKYKTPPAGRKVIGDCSEYCACNLITSIAAVKKRLPVDF